MQPGRLTKLIAFWEGPKLSWTANEDVPDLFTCTTSTIHTYILVLNIHRRILHCNITYIFKYNLFVNFLCTKFLNKLITILEYDLLVWLCTTHVGVAYGYNYAQHTPIPEEVRQHHIIPLMSRFCIHFDIDTKP